MDEDDFMHDDDELEFDFEYEDNEDADDDISNTDLENRYYNAKALRDEDPQAAVAQLRDIVDQDTEDKGEWGFKALKQLLKLTFKKNKNSNNNNNNETLTLLTSVLDWVDSPKITRNYAEKSINNLLDLLSTTDDSVFLEDTYTLVLDRMSNPGEKSNNSSNNSDQHSRMRARANLKLASLLLQHGEYEKLDRILHSLYASYANSDDANSVEKGTFLLELYSLEIQMHTATKSLKKLKALYEQCTRVKSAVPHPRIMAVIRECGGKMHMSEENWDKAHADFLEAFRSYEESGDARRIQCLKYMVLASMLMNSTIDPFESQETKPYQNHPDIVAMKALSNAYQRKDIIEVGKVLSKHKRSILDDAFIESHIFNLLKSIRLQVIIRIIQPYTRVKISYIADQAKIEESEVNSLLTELILDERIDGYIDQITNALLLNSIDRDLFNASLVRDWVNNIERRFSYISS